MAQRAGVVQAFTEGVSGWELLRSRQARPAALIQASPHARGIDPASIEHEIQIEPVLS